jgi:hypothetical protein
MKRLVISLLLVLLACGTLAGCVVAPYPDYSYSYGYDRYPYAYHGYGYRHGYYGYGHRWYQTP